MFCSERIGVIEASTKSGKAQTLTSLVYTPSGPVEMGQLKVGAEVLGHDGNIYCVTGVFPQGLRQSYIVTFNDGTEIVCDGEHLWETQFYEKSPQILTTLELLRIPTWRFLRTAVPSIKAAFFLDKEIPLDPYLLGALLGDGGLTGSSVIFSSTDDEILQNIAQCLPTKHRLRRIDPNKHDYAIAVTPEDLQQVRLKDGNIKKILADLGLIGKLSHEKKIPRDYLYNSEEVRWGLLQGIMDTDGSVNQKGQPILEQCSEQLAKDVKELVESLGGSVKTTWDDSASYWSDRLLRQVQGRRRYRQTIRLGALNTKCFRLRRKIEKLVLPKKRGARLFSSVRLGAVAEMQCISVSNPRQLYLTNGLIPTHNTISAIAWLIEQALKGKEGYNYWWIAPGYNQAEIAYRRIKLGLSKGAFTSFDTPTPRIKTLIGSWIYFKSADNADSLYGEDVYAAVIDEASRVGQESWFAVRSTVTATRGPIRAIGNVKGRKNWFYDLCRKAEAGTPGMHYAKITADDAVQAGVLDSAEIEEARRDFPEHVFRELYYAEPGDDSGNPFGLNHIRACTTEGFALGPIVAWGIDLAKSQDYFVCIGLNESGGVVALHRWRGVPWRQSIRRVWNIVGEDTPALVDSTGVGDPVLEELQHEHGNFIGFHFSSTSKQKLMEGLAVSIQSQEITFPKGQITYELECFEYEVKPSGIRYSAPPGQNDDCVAALALARQMWAETAPGANIMKFYESESRKLRQREAGASFDNNRPWRNEPTAITLEAELGDSDLAQVYAESWQKTLPSAQTLCPGCKQIVVGPSRVTDGEFTWHVGCAGHGAQPPRIIYDASSK